MRLTLINILNAKGVIYTYYKQQQERENNVDDPRGKLFEDYLEIVNNIKPKFFVMENVKGLLSMEHDKQELNSAEKKELSKIKSLENEKIDLMLRRKQSKNTNKIKFSIKEKEKLED